MQSLFPPPPLLKLCGGTADATPAFVVGLLKSLPSDFIVTEVTRGGDLVPYHPSGAAAGDLVVDPCLDDVRADVCALNATEHPPAKRRVAAGAASSSSSASPLWGRFPFVVAGADGPEQQFRDMFGAPAFEAAAALHERCKATDETSSGAPPPPLAETLDIPLLPGDDTPEKRGKCHALVRALWPALRADRWRTDQESRAGGAGGAGEPGGAGGAGGASAASRSNTSTSSAVVALDVVGGGGGAGGVGGIGGAATATAATAATAATGMRLSRNDLFDRLFYTGTIGKPRTTDSEMETGTTGMDITGTGNDAGDTGTTTTAGTAASLTTGTGTDTGTGTGTGTDAGTGTSAAGVGGAGGVGSGREGTAVGGGRAVGSMAESPPGATLNASEVFRLQTYKANGAMHPSAKDGVALVGRESKGDRTRLHQALAKRCPYVVVKSLLVLVLLEYHSYSVCSGATHVYT